MANAKKYTDKETFTLPTSGTGVTICTELDDERLRHCFITRVLVLKENVGREVILRDVVDTFHPAEVLARGLQEAINTELAKAQEQWGDYDPDYEVAPA